MKKLELAPNCKTVLGTNPCSFDPKKHVLIVKQYHSSDCKRLKRVLTLVEDVYGEYSLFLLVDITNGNVYMDYSGFYKPEEAIACLLNDSMHVAEFLLFSKDEFHSMFDLVNFVKECKNAC